MHDNVLQEGPIGKVQNEMAIIFCWCDMHFLAIPKEPFIVTQSLQQKVSMYAKWFH
jgi:hypothetical protein